MLTFRLCKQNPHHQKLLPHTDRNVIRNCVVALSHQALNLRTGGADWVKEVKMLKSLVVGAKKFIRYKFFEKNKIFLFKERSNEFIFGPLLRKYDFISLDSIIEAEKLNCELN